MADSSSFEQAAATYSVAESALILGIPTRTLHQWIKDGKITTRPPELGERGVRLVAATVENLRHTRAAASSGEQPAAASSRSQQMAAGLSPDAAGMSGYPRQPAVSQWETHRAELAEQERDLLRSNLDHHAEEIAHLRAQLEQRARELERRDQAEAELRRLLLVSQQALQTAIEQRALPPHVEPPTPKRTRWWALWWRG